MIPLPTPPQIPQFQQGQRSQPAQQPFQPSGAAQILQGVAGFVKDYRASQEADKEKKKQEFSSQLQMLQQGIPLDLKQVAKTAQKAGIPFDFNAPTAEQINYQHQKIAQENNAQQQSLALQTPGVVGGDQANAMLPPPQMGPPPPSAAPPQSRWQNFAQAAGWSQPPVAPTSPGMYALQQILKAGQMGRSTAELSQALDQKTQMIRKAALEGNPQGVELYTRLGGMKELGKGELDELTRAARSAGMPDPENKAANLMIDAAMGGPQQRLAQMKQAWEQVNKDVDTRTKAVEMAQKMTEDLPGLPSIVAQMYTLGSITGNTQMVGAANKVVEGLKSKAQLAQENVQFEQKQKQFGNYVDLEKLKLEGGRLGVSQGELALGGQRLQVEKYNVDAQIINAVRGTLGKRFDDLYRIASDKNIDVHARDAALTSLVNAGNKIGTLKVRTTDGREIDANVGNMTKDSWSWALGIVPFSGTTTDPWSTVNTAPGNKPTQQQMGVPPPNISPEWLQQMMQTRPSQPLPDNRGRVWSPDAPTMP